MVMLIIPVGCSRLMEPSQYGSVSVATVSSSGAPLAGVPLQLYTGSRPLAYAMSDERGRFIFEQVPSGAYGVIATIPPSYADVGEPPFVSIDGLEVAGHSVEPVRFILDPCIGTLEVSVRDLNATTAAGITVNVYDAAGRTVQLVKTGSAGVARTTLPCATYGAQIVNAPGFTAPPGKGSSFQDDLAVHRSVTRSVALRVESCLGTLRIAAQDGAGNPVPGAGFVVYAPGGNLALGITDATGRAPVLAPCGTDLGVSISAPAGYSVPMGRGSSFFDGIRTANGAATDVVFRLNRP